MKGCCCRACTDAPRLLRPPKAGGQYGNWQLYAEEGEAPSRGMGPGQRARQTERRRRRLEQLRARALEKKEERLERRRLVDLVMEARRHAAPEQQAREEDPAWQRLKAARLRLMEARHARLTGAAGGQAS